MSYWLEQVSEKTEEEVESWFIFYYTLFGLMDDDFDYKLFEWKDILKDKDYNVLCCYDDEDDVKILQGLCAYHFDENELVLDFIASAPWNYYKVRKESQIYEPLICDDPNYKYYKKSNIGKLMFEIFINDFYEINENLNSFILYSRRESIEFYIKNFPNLTRGTETAEGLTIFYMEKFC